MAYYDLKKKPALTTKEGEEDVLYPQLITAGTIPAEKLSEYTAQRSGFNKGDIDGVLMSLFDTMSSWINMGYSVEMGDFGFFTGKVKGRLVRKKTDIRAPSIRFGNVNFRPSAKFKKALSGNLERVQEHQFRQSTNFSMEELERRLMNYLDKNGFINIVTYSQLTGRLKWKAAQDLNYFVEKGLIVSRGAWNQKHYVKAVKQD
jgi:predicted histone-like DNA-binding protein